MAVRTDEGHVLFIEPKGTKLEDPVRDDLVAVMQEAVERATPDSVAYRGFHRCACGATSSNRDYVLESGQKTNSLCVHYLLFHRSEIPEAELEKVRRLTPAGRGRR